MGLPRGSFYRRSQAAEDGPLREAMLRLAGEWPTYGYRRLAVMLRREGFEVNGKRVRRLMHEAGIIGRPPTRKPRTTDSAHGFPRHPNLVGGLGVARPDQVWVADITYVRLRSEFVYLAVLTDVFTRSIRGWHLGRSQEGLKARQSTSDLEAVGEIATLGDLLAKAESEEEAALRIRIRQLVQFIYFDVAPYTEEGWEAEEQPAL